MYDSDSDDSFEFVDKQGPQDKFWPYFDFIADPESEEGDSEEEEEVDFIKAYLEKKTFQRRRDDIQIPQEERYQQEEEDPIHEFRHAIQVVAAIAKANPQKGVDDQSAGPEPVGKDY